MTDVKFSREVLATIKASFPNHVIAEHQIRAERIIDNQTNKYDFKVLEDTSSNNKVETRINKNDLMYVTGIGLFIYNRKGTNDPNASTEAVEPLQTYPNESYFAASAGHVPAHLEFIYKGSLFLQVGDTVFIPGLHTDKFKYVPQTQQSSATNKSQYRNQDAIVELAQHYKIYGSDTVDLSLNVKTFAAIKAAADPAVANTENRVVLILDGFVVRNGAQGRK